MWREEHIFESLRRNLQFTGFLQERSLKNNLKTYGLVAVLTLTVFVYIANLFIPTEVEDYLANVFEAFTAFLHFLVKIASLAVYQGEFQKITNDRQKFWQLDCMGAEIELKLKKFRRYFTSGFKTYLVLVFLVYSAMVVEAVVFHELPFPCWLPDGDLWRYGVLYYQFAIAAYGAYIVTTFDFMFLACYLDAYIQMKLLNCYFSKVETADDIGKCKDHHNFIFGYVRTVNDIFSISILVQYFLTITLCCMLITIAADPSQHIATVVKCVSHLIAQVLQVGFYCVGPSFLEDESDKTLTSVWGCDWYNKDMNFQKYILFVLTFSRSKISISGGGLMEANRVAFLNVFKTTYTVYTLIRATTDL